MLELAFFPLIFLAEVLPQRAKAPFLPAAARIAERALLLFGAALAFAELLKDVLFEEALAREDLKDGDFLADVLRALLVVERPVALALDVDLFAVELVFLACAPFLAAAARVELDLAPVLEEDFALLADERLAEVLNLEELDLLAVLLPRAEVLFLPAELEDEVFFLVTIIPP